MSAVTEVRTNADYVETRELLILSDVNMNKRGQRDQLRPAEDIVKGRKDHPSKKVGQEIQLPCLLGPGQQHKERFRN